MKILNTTFFSCAKLLASLSISLGLLLSASTLYSQQKSEPQWTPPPTLANRVAYQGLLLTYKTLTIGEGESAKEAYQSIAYENETCQIIVRIFDAPEAGGGKWAGGPKTITTDENAYFDVVLSDERINDAYVWPLVDGAITREPLSSCFMETGSSLRWIEITLIDPDTKQQQTLSPRQQFTLTPYAFVAQSVTGSVFDFSAKRGLLAGTSWQGLESPGGTQTTEMQMGENNKITIYGSLTNNLVVNEPDAPLQKEQSKMTFKQGVAVAKDAILNGGISLADVTVPSLVADSAVDVSEKLRANNVVVTEQMDVASTKLFAEYKPYYIANYS